MPDPVKEATVGSARMVLRMVTRDIHERLHSYAGFKDLLDGRISLPTYRELLVRLYQLHLPLETALVRRWPPEIGLDLQLRLRARLLTDDLLAVGSDPNGVNAGPLAPIPPLSSKGHILGCFYVREGSTLGGKVLANHLDPLFGTSARGRSFFLGTSGDGALWRECSHVNEQAAREGHLPDMIEGACSTFAAFESWLGCGAGFDKGSTQ
jgi:heme oxygenase (biliverdin-IX-beta and delta-forming)